MPESTSCAIALSCEDHHERPETPRSSDVFSRLKLDPLYRDSHWQVGFLDDEGHGIFFNTTPKGRYIVSGYGPKGSAMLSQTITVSKDRPAEKIAEDIKRRLLPGYLAAFAKYKERLDAQDKYRAEVEVVCAELAQVMGVKQSTTTLYGPWNSSVAVERPTVVYFECRCTPEVAKKLLVVIKETT